ncbi:PAS domain S-box protein [Marimonas sp. MJW-29]|uniref:PAS domain S-box protein n=1 Tax=Sulfitobacter sediminis TaxID=3234186 RepID=A0ABV3RPM0_9RHOB
MLDTLSIAQLERLLEQFSVPMFVIERRAPDSEFCITCMNSALEELAGHTREDLLGRSTLEIAAAAEDTMKHYQRCVTTHQTIRFAFLFTNQQKEMQWDKILQYSRSPEGHDRVIVTAIKMSHDTPLLQDQIAFEDVRYFSSIADLQLENLSNAFASATEKARVTPIDEERIMRLHAVCRTIQSTVADIKQVVRTAQQRHAVSNRRIERAVSSMPIGPVCRRGDGHRARAWRCLRGSVTGGSPLKRYEKSQPQR